MEKIIHRVWLIAAMLILCITGINTPAFALDKVVVIPLMSHNGKPLQNIVTVAKKNGDFTDPVAAVNSITDAAADNPYLIVIGPGVYTLTETLVMKPYVSISGSGEKTTILTGSNNASRCFAGAIVQAFGDETILSNIEVINTGGGGDQCSNAIATTNVLNHVTAKTQGARINVGITVGGRSKLIDVVAQAKGGEWSVGIWPQYRSRPKLFNVEATALNGSEKTYGIHGDTSSAPLLTNVTVRAEGGKSVTGIVFYSPEYSPVLKEVTVTASGGTMENVGIYYYVYDRFFPITIRRSTISGDTYSLQLYDGHHEQLANAYISQSTILNAVDIESSDGVIQCAACDDGAGHLLSNSCN